MRFGNLYSLDDFRVAISMAWTRSSDWKSNEIADDRGAYNIAIKADAEGRDLYKKHEEEVFGRATLAWLQYLRTTNRMNIIKGLGGRHAMLPEAWNDFVRGTEDQYQRRLLINTFSRRLAWAVVTADKDKHQRKNHPGHVKGSYAPPSEVDIIAAYEKLVGNVEAGNTDVPITLSDIFDSKSGDRMKIKMTGWKATLMRILPDCSYEVAKDVKTIGLETVEK